MPEGWGESKDDDSDVDMEITFTPGLSAAKDEKDETTLEKYQRKMREKKKKRKEELRERTKEGGVEKKGATKDLGDDFFVADSEDEGSAGDTEDEVPRGKKGKGKVSAKKGKGRKADGDDEEKAARVESTAEELALLAASDNPNGEVKHFDMKAVLRAEKKKGRKKKGKKGKKGADDGENEIQEDFSIDVKDDRFKAVLEDHTFAIDPSNPQYVKPSYIAESAVSDLWFAVSRRRRAWLPSWMSVPVDSKKKRRRIAIPPFPSTVTPILNNRACRAWLKASSVRAQF